MTQAPGRPKRGIRLLLRLALAMIAVGVVWITITGLMARSDSHFLGDNLTVLQSDLASGKEEAASQLMETMQSKAADLHARTSGPAWWIASKVPYLGDPADSIRAQAAYLHDLTATALPLAVKAGQTLDPHLLRTGPHSIDLSRLQAAVAPLADASAAVTTAASQLRELPGNSWLGPVNDDRDTVTSQVTALDRGLRDLTLAARLLPRALGQDGVRRYFVAFETDAEARGLGGLPGSYGILRADDGDLRFTRFGGDGDLEGASSHLDFGREFAARYDAEFDPQDVFQNSDSSPHFPYAAQIWMAMWEDKFHQRLDGAVATDPAALGYLLSATGAVTLADGTEINGSDSVRFFENALYIAFPSSDLAARKAFQVLASQAVASHVLHQRSEDLVASATGMRQAAEEGRLLVYTSDPSIERALIATPLGGVLPKTTRPFVNLVVNNSSGTKLDYYLGRSLSYSRASCASRSVTVTVTLHNDAPDHDLPDSILGRAPGITPEPTVGENGIVLSLYGTAHSSVRRVTLDGNRQFFQVGAERGHPVTSTHLDIKPGATLTLSYDIHEPAATGPLMLKTQPLVRAQHTTLTGATSCPTLAAAA